mmetsp:Transcript_25962/g.66941  ORF Transcript_25962/g.66941 Transcript_25962/m.66941 type:complete len:257 (-) Transcript_25962:1058-1828(-)
MRATWFWANPPTPAPACPASLPSCPCTPAASSCCALTPTTPTEAVPPPPPLPASFEPCMPDGPTWFATTSPAAWPASTSMACSICSRRNSGSRTPGTESARGLLCHPQWPASLSLSQARSVAASNGRSATSHAERGIRGGEGGGGGLSSVTLGAGAGEATAVGAGAQGALPPAVVAPLFTGLCCCGLICWWCGREDVKGWDGKGAAGVVEVVSLPTAVPAAGAAPPPLELTSAAPAPPLPPLLGSSFGDGGMPLLC